MSLNLSHLLKNKEPLWINVIFYLLCSLLIVILFIYSILILKVYLQNQKTDEMNKRMSAYEINRQKIDEKKVLYYRKKINDFDLVVNNHKISSNIFIFIEKNTLPNIWFSGFDMSQSANNIKLSGQSENMETLSRQVQIFERSKDYIKNITVLNSQVDIMGKIGFTLDLRLNPEIFTYKPSIQLENDFDK